MKVESGLADMPPSNLGDEYALLPESIVEKEIGRCAKTLRAWAKKKKFPQPVELGERSRAYVRVEVEAWIAEKKSKRSA